MVCSIHCIFNLSYSFLHVNHNRPLIVLRVINVYNNLLLFCV